MSRFPVERNPPLVKLNALLYSVCLRITCQRQRAARGGYCVFEPRALRVSGGQCIQSCSLFLGSRPRLDECPLAVSDLQPPHG